jgi:hypothetical protein
MLYEGAVLYQRPLTEWNTYENERGWFAVVGDALEVGVRGGRGVVHGSWTNQADVSNVSVAVEMRLTSGSNVEGCVDSRHDATAGSYAFCLGADGRTWAIYSYRDAQGTWRTEYLLDRDWRAGTYQVTQSNNLKIVSYERQLWFVLNGVVYGPVWHTGRSVGSAAIFVVNWDDQPAAFAFSLAGGSRRPMSRAPALVEPPAGQWRTICRTMNRRLAGRSARRRMK